MDRTVPKTGSEEIELYMRTYYSLLRSSEYIQIEALVESHKAMRSTLHVKAQNVEPDVSAFIYCALRLPGCMPDVVYVVVGQLEKSFIENGYADLAEWERVSAPGRRRRVHFNGTDTLAVFIASRSDIDDLVPMLTAYQIEWNKIHDLLEGTEEKEFLLQNADRETPLTEEETQKLATVMKMTPDEVHRLEVILQTQLFSTLAHIASNRKQMSLRLIASSVSAYRRGTAYWWRELREKLLTSDVDPEQRPVYFVSSNTHSLVNLLTGFARREEQSLLDYLERANHAGLLEEYREIQRDEGSKSRDNFLYYVLKKYLSDSGRDAREAVAADERAVGIHRVPSVHGFEIETQIAEIGKLETDWFDSRLWFDELDPSLLAHSDALVINIDYPLGMAAYEILIRISESVGNFLGIYVMGKAATLNGRIGDVMIPNVIHDEHSQNTYLFNNCFNAHDVVPYMSYGTVLDNQKAISAPSTFLQNQEYMSVFYHEGYTDIEMEGGPYLSAVYEAFRPKRHPMNEIVNLYNVPFDVGFLHYASDRPMSKGHNLGSSNLGYSGIDPTYATAVAVLRRIFVKEIKRLRRKESLRVPVIS